MLELLVFQQHKQVPNWDQDACYEPRLTVLQRILVPGLIDHAESSAELVLLRLEWNSLGRLSPA